MEEKKDYKEELEKIEIKYKKLKKSVLVVLLLILIVFCISTLYKFIILRKVADNNINIDVGNNYKLTRKTDDYTSTTFVKDGIYKTVNEREGDIIITNVFADNKWHSFVEVKDSAENGKIKTYYYERNQETKMFLNRTSLSSNYMMMYDEQSASEKVGNMGILQTILAGNVEIKSTKYNEKDCYKIIHDSHYMIVDKKDFVAINDNGVEIKLEKGVVTDEEIKMPDINEYKNVN